MNKGDVQHFGLIFLLFILLPPQFVTSIRQPNFLLTSLAARKSVAAMGLHLSTEDDKNSSKTTKKLTKAQRKQEKYHEPWKGAWKQSVDQYIDDLLDPSFLHRPVRKNTVDAAALYPQSSAIYNDSNVASLMPGTHKHLGGTYDPVDGTIYGIPANSKAILVIRPNDDGEYRLSTIPLPARIASSSMKWLRGIIAGGYRTYRNSFSIFLLVVVVVNDDDIIWFALFFLRIYSLPTAHALFACVSV
jgi:hypothetical protein